MKSRKNIFFIPKEFKKLFQIIFPSFIMFFLIFFQNSIFNPAGILAIIPIYFYTVFYPSLLPFPIALFGIFLIDTSFNLDLTWLFFFLIIYIIFDFQKWINLKKQSFFSLLFFSALILIFFLITFIVIGVRNNTFPPFWSTLWIIVLLITLYYPLAKTFNNIAENNYDR